MSGHNSVIMDESIARPTAIVYSDHAALMGGLMRLIKTLGASGVSGSYVGRFCAGSGDHNEKGPGFWILT